MAKVHETEKLVPAAELLELPDDGVRRELIRGRVVEMAAAGYDHGKVAMRLGGAATLGRCE